VIVGILNLVDLTLVANLVIVICSSYENFLAPIDPRRHPDCPEGVAGPAEVAEVLNMASHMRGLCGCYA
jgi:uncharacterized membrane protein YqhA